MFGQCFRRVEVTKLWIECSLSFPHSVVLKVLLNVLFSYWLLDMVACYHFTVNLRDRPDHRCYCYSTDGTFFLDSIIFTLFSCYFFGLIHSGRIPSSSTPQILKITLQQNSFENWPSRNLPSFSRPQFYLNTKSAWEKVPAAVPSLLIPQKRSKTKTPWTFTQICFTTLCFSK